MSRTTIRRNPDRANHDIDVRNAILDEALVAHVGYVRGEEPVVIPTLCVRDGDRLLLHGSPAAGHLRAACSGGLLCVTVTITDGLVLARSGFHHSANYRSVVAFGRAERLAGAAKRDALNHIVESIAPGRLSSLREMSEREFRSTEVVSLSLDEASVKVRNGPPIDEESDYSLPIWAGVVPVTTYLGEPITDPRSDAPVPAHVRRLVGVRR